MEKEKNQKIFQKQDIYLSLSIEALIYNDQM